MPITITEALAEIKTINKRIAKKRDGLMGYLARADGVRDPMERDGGSAEFINAERQAIGDLEERLINLRRGIQAANDRTVVAVNDAKRSISEWLTWRRDVAPGQQAHLARIRAALSALRDDAKRKGNTVFAGAAAVATTGEAKPTDIVVNIDERQLAEEIDQMEDALGQLDGILSLKNATVFIDE